MIFRQLFHQDSATYTYLLGCETTRQAIFIDPVLDKLDDYLQLLNQLDLQLTYAVDTHIHADHITALGVLRDKTNCITCIGEKANAACISQYFKDGDLLQVGELTLKAAFTPGHTEDSYAFIMHDRVFTGDTLLIRGTGRTDFQGGDAAASWHSIQTKLFTLPDATLVYPGHDYKGWTVSTIGEEKQFNPRLAQQNKQSYIDIMQNLNLPDPKLMDVAVPTNQQCGQIK